MMCLALALCCLAIGALGGVLGTLLWWLRQPAEEPAPAPAPPVMIDVDAPWLTFLLRSVGAEVRWPNVPAQNVERMH